MSTPYLTECGLPGIRQIPYGVHLCHFYTSAQDLAEALVPFFAAGLRKNERCIWVTAAPLPAAEARVALARAVADVDAMLASDRLRIIDFEGWYKSAVDGLKGNDVAGVWLEEERAALAAGYAGLRINGNTSFLVPEDWDAFMEYERVVGEAFRGRRIVALCSYAAAQCGAAERLDVVRRHECAIERTDASWQVLA